MGSVPSVSVVIPTANRSSLLKRAALSVLQQSYRDFECIIVDDASVDDTREVVASFDDSRIVYLRHDVSRHASASRNTGIKAARGEYIAFLDDDDEWLETKLAKQVALLNASSQRVGLVYCWFEYRQDGKLVSCRKPVLAGDIFREALSRQPIGNSSTLLVRKTVIDDVGGFDESLPRGNDGDFIRRVCQKYHVAVVKETLVSLYVGHGHERITSNDRAGIKNGLNALYSRLQKFASERENYPKEFSEIYGSIAIEHSRLGEFGLAIKNLFCAYKICFFSRSNGINSLKVLKKSLSRRVVN